MKNAIILHGLPTKKEYYDPKVPNMSNAHWLPWLQAQLIKNNIIAATPEVPKSYEANWNEWVREVERYDIGPNTILVGHSCGGGFWVRYLSERSGLKVGKVILVAPWLDPDKNETDDFFNFEIDPELGRRIQGMSVFHSDNDMGNIHKSVAILRENFPDITYRECRGYGHFTAKDLKGTEFPELLEEILPAK